MNEETLQAIVAETAERVTGRRITRVVERAANWLELWTDAPEHLRIGLSAVKALPLLYVAEAREEPSTRPAPEAFADLAGSTILSMAAVPGERAVVLRTGRTDPAGRRDELELRLETGRRPSLSVAEAGPAGPERTGVGAKTPERVDAFEGPGARGAGGGSAAPSDSARPSVAWRRDSAGRLHIGLPPNEGHWDGTVEFDSWNDAAVHASADLLPEIVISARREGVVRTIERTLTRKRRALDKVRAEIADSENADEYRHKAQLLLTRKGALKRGERLQRVLDYDNVTEVEIEVDPAVPAARNAEALFARARKAERRAKRAPERASELLGEIEALENTLTEVATAPPAVISELEERFHPPRRRRRRRRGEQRVRFRTYVVSGGWKVLVGKSNRDNDILTHRIARPSDLWFHVRQSPGSHVVLQKAGSKSEPDLRAISEAAAIAAFHSKSAGGSAVPVCYTEKRYVRKPRGAKPGLAVVSNEKVIYVEPSLPEER